MKVVILAGGKGTRAYPYTQTTPKAMMPIGGQPIIMHVMQIFAEQGYRDFVLSLGWRKEVIFDYFDGLKLSWNVELIDTGAETDTGGRIEKCKHLLGETFIATYADGLCDVRLDRLVDFHRRQGGLATVTSTPLRSQYGTVVTDDDGRITEFAEKPILREHWINSGFIVFDKAVFKHWPGTNLEQHILPQLARENRIFAYKHDGFFKSMDTHKDQLELEQMCQVGNMPWKTSTRLAA